MNIDAKKSARQAEGAQKWRTSKKHGAIKNGSGVLNYVYGFGKTYGTINYIIKPVLLQDLLNQNVIIVVPSDAIKKQWRIEISKFITYECNIQIFSADELINAKEIHVCTLLVVDELHLFYSEEREKLINKTLIKFKYNVGLTATYEDSTGRHKKHNKLWHVIDKIDEAEGIKEGYISKFIEYNISVDFTQLEKLEYDQHTVAIGLHLPKFNNNLKFVILCLTGGEDKNGNFHKAIQWATSLAVSNGWKSSLDLSIDNNIQINNLWNPSKIIGYAKLLMDAIRLRKDIVYNAHNKISITTDIIEKFKELKTICFSQSTAFADKVALSINERMGSDYCVVYHSNVSSRPLKGDDGHWITYKSGNKEGQIKLFGKTTLKNIAIDAIKNGKAGAISSSSALDAGFNVESIRMSITTSGTANVIQQKQRRGRVVRIEKGYNDNVLIINVYIKDSVDENWLRKRQQKSSTIPYSIHSIEQIRIKNTKKINPFTIQ